MRAHLRVGLAALLACSACDYAISGPLRTLPLESVAPVGEGRGSIGVSGGTHGGWVGHASGRGRVGLARDVDVGGEGSWVTFGDPSQGSQYGIGHVDVRHRVHESVAFSGGMGLGGGAYGFYGGPDLGVIFAYENPELVPFLALRAGVSVPLVPTPHVSTSMNPDGTTTTHTVPPITTLYLQPSFGLRLPIVLDASGRRLVISAGACVTTATLLHDAGGTGWGIGGELGVELIL